MDSWLKFSILLVIFGLVHGQADIDQSIKEIFGETSESSESREKCTCVPYQQCRRNGTNFGEGLIDERISCGREETCCDKANLITGEPSSSSSQKPPTTTQAECVCVPVERCDANYGEGIIGARKSCDRYEICCDKEFVLPENRTNQITSTSQKPTVTTPACTCVPVNQCGRHFGQGIIGERKSCDPHEICCDNDAIVPDTGTPATTSPTTSSPEKCICVPSSQCNRQGPNFGEGIIDERKSCNMFEVCCDRSAIIATEKPVTPITSSQSPITNPIKCTCVPTAQCRREGPNFGEGIIDERRSCNPYEVCCENNSIIPSTSITPAPPLKKCGYRKIFNGLEVRITEPENTSEFGEFPWMTAVLEDQNIDGNPNNLVTFRCGASLIHPQVVLTGAHCVNMTKKYRVRVGEWDVTTMDEAYSHQDVEVKQIIVHPKFYKAALFNDAALLYLKNPVELKPNVNVVCLPSAHQVVQNTRCIVTGWGKDKWDKKAKYATLLRKIDVPIVARNTCQELLRKTRLGRFFELHESFVCAGGEEGKDSCKGDGGSPLVCPIPGHSDQFFQAGIVAWGIDCGSKDVPGVYGNVAEFRDWIEDETNKLGIDINEYQYYY